MNTVRSVLLFVLIIVLGGVSFLGAQSGAPSSGKWKITSIKICRHRSGALLPSVNVIGNYPVYSFFIPRPVWTVNGSVVEAQPVYDHGRLVEFQLVDASALLKSDTKNTIKFSLPEQNQAKVFHFSESRIKTGECFEFF